MSGYIPTEPPTPTDFAVLAIAISVLLIVLGVVSLVVAFRASPDQQDAAAELEYLGFLSIGIGVAIAVVYHLIRRYFRS